MATVGNLEVRIGADASSFEAGLRSAVEKLDKLEGATEKAGRKMQAFGSKLQAAGGAATKYISGPIAGAGAAAAAFAVKFANAADATAKAADKIGIGTDALQEMRFAAERGGVGAQTLDTAIQRLSRRTGEAAKGTGTLKKVLEEYGIAATDATGAARPVEEMLGEIANAMDGASSEGEKLRIAIAAFDTEGAGMVNVLRGGSDGMAEMRQEARSLGAVIGEETLRDAEKFSDSMTNFQTQLSAAGNAVGVALIPALNELLPVLTENIVPAVTRLAEGVAGAIEWFAALPAPVQEASGIIAAALGAAGPAMMAVGLFSKAVGALVVASGPIGLFIAAATLAYTAWQMWGEQITELVGTTLEWLSETWTAFSERAVEIWTNMGTMILEAFRAPFDAIKGLSDSVVNGMAEGWQWLSDTLVGNSVIPDMMEMMEEQFGRMWGMADTSDRVARSVSGAWKKSADEQKKSIKSALQDSMALFGQFFEGSKGFAIAQGILDMYSAIAGAYKVGASIGGPPLGSAYAAIAGAAQAATLASIKSTTASSGSASRQVAGGSVPSAASQEQRQERYQAPQRVVLEGLDRGRLYDGDAIVDALQIAIDRGATIEFAR